MTQHETCAHGYTTSHSTEGMPYPGDGHCSGPGSWFPIEHETCDDCGECLTDHTRDGSLYRRNPDGGPPGHASWCPNEENMKAVASVRYVMDIPDAEEEREEWLALYMKGVEEFRRYGIGDDPYALGWLDEWFRSRKVRT